MAAARVKVKRAMSPWILSQGLPVHQGYSIKTHWGPIIQISTKWKVEKIGFASDNLTICPHFSQCRLTECTIMSYIIYKNKSSCVSISFAHIFDFLVAVEAEIFCFPSNNVSSTACKHSFTSLQSLKVFHSAAKSSIFCEHPFARCWAVNICVMSWVDLSRGACKMGYCPSAKPPGDNVAQKSSALFHSGASRCHF